MNCKKVVQLIPLFVEADLAIAEMRSVTEHLETCDSCGNTVKEFQASQLMLRSVTLPEFDENVFSQVRSSVLDEIIRPKNTDLIHPIWNWKAAFAATLAMIFLTSGIAMYRSKSKENITTQAFNTREVEANNFSFTSSKKPVNASTSFALKQIPKPRSGRNSIAQGEASVSKRNHGNVNTNHPSPERVIAINDQIIAAAIAPSGANNQPVNLPGVDTPGFMLLPPALQAENTTTLTAPNSEKSTSEPEMLRMEIQTADPNIKIIWLLPQERMNTQSDHK